MKWVIASDIHGNSEGCRKLMAAMEAEQADRLLLLGDLFSHGSDDADDEVAAMLNRIWEKILCVQGNCDIVKDQDRLEFSILQQTLLLEEDGLFLAATHGSEYNESWPPPFAEMDVLLQGHTHTPFCRRCRGFIAMNPGSVGRPRGGSAAGYMTYEKRNFCWKTLEGECFREYTWE